MAGLPYRLTEMIQTKLNLKQALNKGKEPGGWSTGEMPKKSKTMKN